MGEIVLGDRLEGSHSFITTVEYANRNGGKIGQSE
jgi:hypothetical protein